MKSVGLYDRILRLFLPVGALAGLAGIFQDLVVPLAKIGIWIGLVALAIGLLLLVIGEQTRLGQRIKSIFHHWKMPLVSSFLFLGMSILGMSEITARYQSENGYLAANFNLFKVIQHSLISIEEDANIIRDTAGEILVILGETNNDLEITEDNLRKTAEEQLHQMGHSVTNIDQIFRIFTGYQGEDLQKRLQLLKDSKFDLNRSVRPYSYWGDAYTSYINKIAGLPRRMRIADALVTLDLPFNVWQEILAYFPDLLVSRSSITNGYALEDYPYSLPPNTQFGWISIRNGSIRPSHNEISGGYTLLHTAAVLNSYVSVDALLRLKADIDAITESGYTALALASEHGNFDVAELLLRYGASASAQDWLAVEIALLRASTGFTPSDYGYGYGYSNRFTFTSDIVPAESNEYLQFAARLLNGNPLPENLKSRIKSYYMTKENDLNTTELSELFRYIDRVNRM